MSIEPIYYAIFFLDGRFIVAHRIEKNKFCEILEGNKVELTWKDQDKNFYQEAYNILSTKVFMINGTLDNNFYLICEISKII